MNAIRILAGVILVVTLTVMNFSDALVFGAKEEKNPPQNNLAFYATASTSYVSGHESLDAIDAGVDELSAQVRIDHVLLECLEGQRSEITQLGPTVD